MLIDDIAYVMDDVHQRTDEWLQDYLNTTWRGVVRLSGITFTKREIVEAYIKQPVATVYVPWRQETVTDKRIEFTTGKHSPLMFHALHNSYLKYGRFDEGLEALELIPMNFLFGLASTVGTNEINPVNAHFMQGTLTQRNNEKVRLFDYYVEAKQELKLYGGLSRSGIYRNLTHVGALQKMASTSTLVDDLPLRILKARPLVLHDWLTENKDDNSSGSTDAR